MRRSLLVSLMVLGMVLTVAGGAGIFAPFTDRATSGPNSIGSGERPRAADLQLAFPVGSIFGCSGEAYADDTTSPGFTAVDAQPGYHETRLFCLKNVGSSPVNVDVKLIDVVDIDVACTGDEQAAGDATCGGDQQGEIGSVVSVYAVPLDCASGTGPEPVYGGFIADSAPMVLGTLAAGEIMCGWVEVFYGLNRPAMDVLVAQSDTVTWKYAFDGTT